MAEQNIRNLVAQLQRLTPDQVKELQSHIDVLEQQAGVSFHHSHQTPGSHHTQFNTTAKFADPLETIEEQASQVRGQ